MASDVCNTLSPNPSPLMERGTSDPLEMIAEGRHSVEAVCIESDMSILELAAHVCTAQNLETLARVARLHALEQEMLLGKLKRDALVRLAELTDEVPGGSADEIRAFEVMRKACTDILRFGNCPTRSESDKGPGGDWPRGYRGEYPGGGYHPEPLTPASEAEVLEALEKLGEERIEDELPAASPPELATCTSPPGMHGQPAPPHDGSNGQGQSGHCPGCPSGVIEEHAGSGTKHGTVGLDDAHPP